MGLSEDRSHIRVRLIRTTLALALSIVLVLCMFPPFELIDYLYFTLTTGFNVDPEVFIMISDLLLLLGGILLAYSLSMVLFLNSPLTNQIGFLNKRFNKNGISALTAAAIIIVYWHLPFVVDSALLSFDLHVVMHMWLFVAGILFFIGAGQLSNRTRKIAAIFGCKAMGIFGVFLLVTSGSGYNRFYSIYPITQQAQLGLSMMLMMFVFEGFLVPYWLYRYFTSTMTSPT